MPTNTQLKQALAKMLPDILESVPCFKLWNKQTKQDVLDNQLLDLCWLVEETFLNVLGDKHSYIHYLEQQVDMRFDVIHATWQQRTIALCKVKGIKI